jgi:hypothetical protein
VGIGEKLLARAGELYMELIEPPVEKGKVVVSKYECPNRHTVEVTERI